MMGQKELKVVMGQKELKVVVGQGGRRAYPQLIHPPTYPTLPRWARRGKGGGKEMVQKLGQNLASGE